MELWYRLWRAARPRHWRLWWLGPAGGLLVAVLALAFRTREGRRVVAALAVTHARDPLPVLVVRLPLSVFAPAELLPFAFAVVQVTLVFAAAQVLLGWRRTLAVALAGHALATLSARAWVWLGEPLGVAHRHLDSPDAGPSVAVLALAGYVMVATRAGWLAALLSAYHLGETLLLHGLAQREHLVGVLVGILLGVLLVRARHRVPARHRYRRGAVVLGPLAAGAAAVADLKFQRGTVHPQRGVVVRGHLAGVGPHVVPDERTPEPVGGRVRSAAVHQRTVEEQHVSGFHADVTALARRCDAGYRRGDPLGRYQSRLCLEQLLLVLHEDAVLPAPGPVDTALDEIAHDIRREPGRRWAVAELARRATLSRAQFTRRFTVHTGRSPGRFLIEARIDRARHLQAETTMSVTQIAAALGYAYVTYFSRQYRRETGGPPRRSR